MRKRSILQADVRVGLYDWDCDRERNGIYS
jgi:hypothetical protein